MIKVPVICAETLMSCGALCRNTRPYDITPDGRILDVGTGQTPTGSPGPAQIQVVLKRFEELKARVPTR